MITAVPTVTCPKCASVLVAEGVAIGQRIICAACRAPFFLDGAALADARSLGSETTAQRDVLGPRAARPLTVSRGARWSLVLAIVSFLPFMGFAAVIAGILGVRDIRRHPAKIGLGKAASGIIVGLLSSLVWVFIATTAGIAISRARGMFSSGKDTKVERFALESNGLTVLLRPVAGASQVAVVTLYSIGGDHDPEGQSGLGHLIEHLYVTAATSSRPSRTADEFMRAYPSGWNAQTGDLFTVIATVAPKDSLEKEIEQAADRMGNLSISAADLDREKPRLCEEVQNMFTGTPQLVAYNNAREQIRPTPRGGRKGGLPEHVSALTLETVRERWQRFYKPKNATLVVAGAIDAVAVRELIAKYFGNLPTGEPIPLAAEPIESAPQSGSRRIAAKTVFPGVTSELCVAYPAPPRDDELFPAFLVLVARLGARAQILNAGPNRSPLDYSPIFDPSTLFITLPMKPDETVEQAQKRLELFTFATTNMPLGVGDRLVAKNRFGIDLRASDPPDSMLGQNLYYLAFATGRRAMLQMDETNFGDAINAVTQEQLQRVVRDVFLSDRRVTIIASPE